MRDARPLYLYRTGGERSVRAPSPHAAAWLYAQRFARRLFGRRGRVASVRVFSHPDFLGLHPVEVCLKSPTGQEGWNCFNLTRDA